MIKPQPAPATVDSLRAALQAGILAAPEAVQTEAFVLQSRLLASETIARLHLDQRSRIRSVIAQTKSYTGVVQSRLSLFNEVQSRLRPFTGILSGQAECPVDSDQNQRRSGSMPDEPSTVCGG